MKLLDYLNAPILGPTRNSWFGLPFSWKRVEISNTASHTVTTISSVSVPPEDIDTDGHREDCDDPPPVYPDSSATEGQADHTQTSHTSDDKDESDVPDEIKRDDEDEEEVTYSTSWTNYSSHAMPHHHAHVDPLGPEFYTMMEKISHDAAKANDMAQRHIRKAAQRQIERSLFAEATRNWDNGSGSSSSRFGSNATHGFVDDYSSNIYISGFGTSNPKRRTERRGGHTVNIVGCNNVVNTSISNVGNINHTKTVIVNRKVFERTVKTSK